MASSRGPGSRGQCSSNGGEPFSHQQSPHPHWIAGSIFLLMKEGWAVLSTNKSRGGWGGWHPEVLFSLEINNTVDQKMRCYSHSTQWKIEWILMSVAGQSVVKWVLLSLWEELQMVWLFLKERTILHKRPRGGSASSPMVFLLEIYLREITWHKQKMIHSWAVTQRPAESPTTTDGRTYQPGKRPSSGIRRWLTGQEMPRWPALTCVISSDAHSDEQVSWLPFTDEGQSEDTVRSDRAGKWQRPECFWTQSPQNFRCSDFQFNTHCGSHIHVPPNSYALALILSAIVLDEGLWGGDRVVWEEPACWEKRHKGPLQKRHQRADFSVT